MAQYLENKNLKNTIELIRKFSSNKRIVLASGAFDVITIFDIRYLRDAKNAGDILIVAVFPDEVVKQKFGEKRPVTPFEDRVEILKEMEMVDYIIRLESDNMDEILDSIHPDFVIDGRPAGYDVVQAVLAKCRK